LAELLAFMAVLTMGFLLSSSEGRYAFLGLCETLTVIASWDGIYKEEPHKLLGKRRRLQKLGHKKTWSTDRRFFCNFCISMWDEPGLEDSLIDVRVLCI